MPGVVGSINEPLFLLLLHEPHNPRLARVRAGAASALAFMLGHGYFAEFREDANHLYILHGAFLVKVSARTRRSYIISLTESRQLVD